MIKISNILEVKNHIEGLKTIIFDMDDTLYGEKEYVKSGYQKIAEAFPNIENAASRLWELFEQKKPAIDVLLEQENLLTQEMKRQCVEIYRYQEPAIHLYEGVKELLMNLRNQGYQLGIITDGRPEGQRAKIKALGLENLVDHIIVTDELGGIEFRKPNPTAFELMKEKFGVEFQEMCYIGDNLKKDFASPDQLGMRSIHFENQDGLYFQK